MWQKRTLKGFGFDFFFKAFQNVAHLDFNRSFNPHAELIARGYAFDCHLALLQL